MRTFVSFIKPELIRNGVFRYCTPTALLLMQECHMFSTLAVALHLEQTKKQISSR